MRIQTNQPSSRTHAACRTTAGFTLVEVLVVVVILGIIGAIVVPQISSRSDLKAAAAARMLIADLTYAQNRAISTQSWVYISFNTDAQTYTLLSALPSTKITHPVNKSPFVIKLGTGGNPGLTDCSIASATFDNRSVLVFDEMGTPYSSTGVSTFTPVALTNGTIQVRSGTNTLTITIDSFTGRMSVN